jgi:peptide/nickel transport system substrate-binding protein
MGVGAMALKRRTLLAAGAATLAAPRVARAATVLKFVPYVDLAILDPIINTAAQTRTHAYLVFDTLYGCDDNYQAQPEMVEGHVQEDNHRVWTLTLRQGLLFHDGTPVLGRDVVASVRRWGAHDVFGTSLLDATDEISAPDDRTIRFRMKKPFFLLPDALGKIAPTMPAIMPERLAALDPTKPVPELIGSGPFRYVASERVPGARNVYERFERYVPRSDGTPGQTCGPKIVNVDRVEWITMPDGATAAAALQAGEVDWLEAPNPDLIPLLRRDEKIVVDIKDKTGTMPIIRFNSIQPPFDNATLRRAVLGAVDQQAFMSAFSSDPVLWHVKVGVFTPGTPMDNDAGLATLFGRTDFSRAKQAVSESGYKGERVVLMGPTDHPVNSVVAQVAADLLQKIGLNVDLQAMDAGTMFQRRGNRGPVDKGGWSIFPSMLGGLDVLNPAVAFVCRGNGLKAWYGWPTSDRIEQLRLDWFDAGDLAVQRRICRDLQSQIWSDAPHVPVGQVFQPGAWRNTVSGILDGIPKFWNVRKD